LLLLQANSSSIRGCTCHLLLLRRTKAAAEAVAAAAAAAHQLRVMAT
jgi:hypothetical protein